MPNGQDIASGRKVAAPDIGATNRPSVQFGPRWAVIGIFIILLGGALYLTATFTLPVIFAFLFALVLSPIVRFARRRLKIWEPVSAAILVFGTMIAIIAGFYMVSGPLTQIAMNAPEYIRAVDDEISSVRDRFSQLSRARSEAVATVDAVNGTEAAAEESQEVVVQSPDLIGSAASTVPQLGAAIAFALIFLFFLLSSGSLFHQKLIDAMPTFSDKKLALSIAHEIERELSRYLFTITVINACLGLTVGTLLWWVEFPNAPVFGALAFLLNFIPYIGAIIGMGLVGIVALTEFGTVGQALIPVLLYFATTTVEGQFVTPLVVGRRLEMNAAAVFLSVAFWGWIWGVVGMFLAVPIMVGIKILSNYVDGLQTFGNFLSSERSSVPDDPGEPSRRS